jgi:hypothetical protein
MGSFQWKGITLSVLSLGVAFTLPNLAAAQSQPTATQIGQPNRVSVAYVPTDDLVLKEVYDLLRDRRALERVQEMLSPFIYRKS